MVQARSIPRACIAIEPYRTTASGPKLRDRDTARKFATALAAFVVCTSMVGNSGIDLARGTTGTAAPAGRAGPSAWPALTSASAPAWPATAGPLTAKPLEFVRGQPATPFVFQGNAAGRERAVECLADAAWYEAGDDPAGERAVVQVVLNRLRHPAFPKSVCGVVFQGSHLPTGCQFTFTCDGSRLQRRPSGKALERSRLIAEQALQGEVFQEVGAATHYHADYVTPWWSHKLDPVTKLGAHIFYSWKGPFGRLPTGTLASVSEPAIPVPGRPGSGVAVEVVLQADTNQITAVSRGDAVASVQPGAAVKTVTDSTIYMNISSSGPSGRWAIKAMQDCAAQKSCLVLGYPEGTERGARRPIFLFVRDQASSMDLALWDCDRVTRPSADQCLPANEQALARLMRPR